MAGVWSNFARVNHSEHEFTIRELKPEPLQESPPATTSTTDRNPSDEDRRAIQAALARSLREHRAQQA